MKRVECHAIYGIGGASIGRGITALDHLMDNLSPVWDCSLWDNGDWEKMSDGIIARQKRYKDNPTVIFICHSKGCLAAMLASWRLKSAGIEVTLIEAIDPTALLWFGMPFLRMGPPMVVTGNIKYIDEFWASSGPPAMARRADPSGKSGGRYIYPDWFPKDNYSVHSIPGWHIPCASDPKTVKVVVEAVKALTK